MATTRRKPLEDGLYGVTRGVGYDCIDLVLLPDEFDALVHMWRNEEDENRAAMPFRVWFGCTVADWRRAYEAQEAQRVRDSLGTQIKEAYRR